MPRGADDAIRWYGEALTIDPKDPDVSTDLGICYYYLNQPDRSLKQFEHSLSIDPRHTKTMFNMGIVRAFGKQDLQGAAAIWNTLIEIAPDSADAQNARRALDGLKSAHPGSWRRGGGSQAGKRAASAVSLLVRYLLLGLLVVLLARSLWKFVASIVDGASSTTRGPARPPQRGVPMVRDPVCGTFVVPSSALTLTVRGRVTHFCSEKCRRAFQAGEADRAAPSR